MWLLHIYKGSKLIEWLFYTEQDVKEFIKENKPIQYETRYVKIYQKP